VNLQKRLLELKKKIEWEFCETPIPHLFLTLDSTSLVIWITYLASCGDGSF
jgi:hypothetical protein